MGYALRRMWLPQGVATLLRNQWQLCRGMGGNFRAEYAGGTEANQKLRLPSCTSADISRTIMQFRYDIRYIDDYGFEMIPRVPVVFRNPKNGRELPIFCLVD